uniref:C3H1-type domain-containing protein n=1 Tax=Chromera velia CCMP2878 TaxID=1169474 RepID=A0A0G4F5P1_9ALVE|eukprot:Cvel_15360.t1-p1 / transcript=Cvel_15360.t1 / gene=Cvel_15360 / organism=Chromera_velia_CCMP2878 / gene_product=hypothetical protein / transcript_product=hypothetical protein / location=Cvel_scaffold1132:858-2440(-) / protein_length=344 / sequence_SO=supercontig / SO=protein_coding / is_pseudo=false
MCWHFPYGNCVLGDKCNFAHSVNELRPRPDLRKMDLCAYTAKVSPAPDLSLIVSKNQPCPRLPHCAFSHDTSGDRGNHRKLEIVQQRIVIPHKCCMTMCTDISAEMYQARDEFNKLSDSIPELTPHPKVQGGIPMRDPRNLISRFAARQPPIQQSAHHNMNASNQPQQIQSFSDPRLRTDAYLQMHQFAPPRSNNIPPNMNRRGPRAGQNEDVTGVAPWASHSQERVPFSGHAANSLREWVEGSNNRTPSYPMTANPLTIQTNIQPNIPPPYEEEGSGLPPRPSLPSSGGHKHQGIPIDALPVPLGLQGFDGLGGEQVTVTTTQGQGGSFQQQQGETEESREES